MKLRRHHKHAAPLPEHIVTLANAMCDTCGFELDAWAETELFELELPSGEFSYFQFYFKCPSLRYATTLVPGDKYSWKSRANKGRFTTGIIVDVPESAVSELHIYERYDRLFFAVRVHRLAVGVFAKEIGYRIRDIHFHSVKYECLELPSPLFASLRTLETWIRASGAEV